MYNEAVLELTFRNSITCPGCAKQKDKGLVVCWTCFKNDNPKPALKWFDGTLLEWLKA